MRSFWDWVIHVDRILRGEATRIEDFQGDRITFPLGGVTIVLGALGLIAGGCTGSFAFFSRVIYETQAGHGYADGLMQFIASSVKVPLLFALTLLVTFPSLYVFNTLVGAKLQITSLLRLLTAALVVNISVLAAFGPIVTFFAVCTESYHFMILLNVTVFAIAGIIGMMFLVQSLNRIVIAHVLATRKSIVNKKDQEEKTPVKPPEGSAEILVANLAEEPSKPGPLDRFKNFTILAQVRRVFGFWIVIFGLVGAQMAWVLRPFIGDPDLPFTWFRERNSNFFASVMESLRALLGF